MAQNGLVLSGIPSQEPHLEYAIQEKLSNMYGTIDSGHLGPLAKHLLTQLNKFLFAQGV